MEKYLLEKSRLVYQEHNERWATSPEGLLNFTVGRVNAASGSATWIIDLLQTQLFYFFFGRDVTQALLTRLCCDAGFGDFIADYHGNPS